MIFVEKCENQEEWDDVVLSHAGHPLQLWGWGEVKAAHGWIAERVLLREGERWLGAAQILVRTLPWPFTALGYIPRGPLCNEEDREKVLHELAAYVKATHKAVILTIEPDWEGELDIEGWHRSLNTILIPRTLILDLSKSEDELLADMAKKTRQYIRKSGNEAIEIRKVKRREDLAACLEIYKETAKRAQFSIHGDDYYYDIFEKMQDHSPVFAVFHQEKVLAFLWLAISEETAFELYGGMNDLGQQLRANYALKWHTIQTMKKWGLRRYDFNGLLNDGVSTFKQGFASHETMLVGTYDKALSPLYTVWVRLLPFAKKVVRAIKNR